VDEDDDVVVSDDGRRLRPVKSLLRALDILSAIAESDRPATLNEIVTRTGFSRTAAYNVITTFEIRGLVHRDDRNRYELGWELLELGEKARSRSALGEVARPIVEDLAENTGETVLLGVLDRGSVIYVEKAESRRSIRMVEAPGRRRPLNESLTGLVLLSYAPPLLRERYLGQDETIAGQLQERIGAILKRGFATSVQDLEPDLSGASVPVHGPDGQIMAALTVAGPASRLTQARIEEFLPQLLVGASAISRVIFGRARS
jgi:IclR family acetate operon transcriptional repressor